MESTVRLQSLLVRGTRYTLALSLPVTIAAMILARPLIISWVGVGYVDMVGPTQLFLAYQLITGTATIANTMLVGMGLVRAVTLYVLVAVVLNLAISVLLVRPLGISGVIIGTLVGFGITAPLYIRLVLSRLQLRFATFFREAIMPIAPWAVLFAAVLELTAQLAAPGQLLTVVLCCVPAGLVYVAGVVRYSMSRAERSSLLGFLSLPRRTA
jgi:O-antigen/teichoic acid export membrane protein